MSIFSCGLLSSSITVVIPAISESLSISAKEVNWIIMFYTLAIVIFNIPIGCIADNVDAKMIFFLGNLLFFISCVILGSVSNLGLIYISRFLQGISVAAIFATYNTILLDYFSDEIRGKMIGVSNGISFFGLTIGPILGGFLNTYFGFRSIFFIIVILFGIIAITTIKLIPMNNSLFKKVLNLNFSTCYHIDGIKKNKLCLYGILTAIITFLGTFSIGYLASIQLQLIYHFSVIKTSFFLMLQPLVQAITSPIAGKLSDKIFPGKLSSFGILLSAMGLAIFLLSTKYSNSYLIITALVVSGLGFSFFSSPNANLIISVLPKKQCCYANSLLSVLRMIGNTMGMGLITLITTMKIGDASINKTSPYKLNIILNYSYILFIFITLIGLFLSIKSIKLHKSKFSS